MNEGDFFLVPNAELTTQLMSREMLKPSARDLVDICVHWYRPTPKKIQTQLTIGSDDGTVLTTRLKAAELTGAW